jgi:hypothetical protein
MEVVADGTERSVAPPEDKKVSVGFSMDLVAIERKESEKVK